MLAANACFAINTSVSRMLMPGSIPPFGLSLLRISFACLAFFILGQFIKNPVKFTLKEHLKLLLCGVMGASFNQLFFLQGLSGTSPVDASLICTCTPILTMLFAAALIKEPISWKKGLGVFIGLIGAVIIMYTSANHQVEGQTASLWGDILVWLSCVVYALYLVVVQPIMKQHSSIHVMKWVFFYGSIAIVPICWQDVRFIAEPNINTWLELGYALIFGTFTAYLLVSFGLQLLRPTTVSMYNYTQPIITSFIAISIGQDIFTWSKPLAALLIFFGVYLVITSKSRADLNAELTLSKEK